MYMIPYDSTLHSTNSRGLSLHDLVIMIGRKVVALSESLFMPVVYCFSRQSTISIATRAVVDYVQKPVYSVIGT